MNRKQQHKGERVAGFYAATMSPFVTMDSLITEKEGQHKAQFLSACVNSEEGAVR